MKTQKCAKRAWNCMLLGWLPFMIICGFGMSLPVGFRVPIVFLGVFACVISSFLLLGMFRNDELFKSIEELDQERDKYIQATKKLEAKIIEL